MFITAKVQLATVKFRETHFTALFWIKSNHEDTVTSYISNKSNVMFL